jgi:hypothetical protein
MLRATIEHNILEHGHSCDPLQVPSVSYSTPNTWISNTIVYLNKYRIKITSDIPRLSPWMSKDVFIMEELATYGAANTMASINKVRMYLRVVTLSDLLTADRRFFDKDAVRGIRSKTNPNPSFHRYRWPVIPTPTASERAIWNTALMLRFHINEAQMRVPNDYGMWIPSAISYAKWAFSQEEHRLYEREKEMKWVVWRPAPEALNRRTRLSHSFFVRSAQNTLLLPASVKMASVRFINDVTVSLITLGDHVHNAASENHSAIVPVNPIFQGTEGIYQYNISMNNGRIFTDGSYVNGISSYAWAAQPPHFNMPFKEVDFGAFQWHSDFVPGPNEEQHSYRAELGGILAAINYTNSLCNHANITSGVCTLICDNKGALCAAFGVKRPTPRWSSYDIVRQIRHSLSNTPIVWKYKHVKGHQDKGRSMNP